MLSLIPIVAGAAAYGAATADKSGKHTTGEGERKIDCYQIWDRIKHGQGPGSIGEGQSAASRLKRSYAERVRTIDGLAKEMDAAWKGDSATAAQNTGAHPIKAWMADSGEKLRDSDKYLGEQQSAFSTVHTKVQEVPQSPPQNNFVNSITPWTTDTDRAIKEYNQKGQANVDAYNAYVKASSTNAQGMPTYSAVEGNAGDVGVDHRRKRKRGGPGGDDTGNPNIPRGTGVPPGGTPNIPGGGYQPGGTPAMPDGSFKPGEIPGGSGYKPGEIPGGSFKPGGVPGGGGYKPGEIPGWDKTAAAGYTPAKIPSTDFSGSGSGFGPGGPGAGTGFGAGFGPGGTGGLSGFGPGASGVGPGAGTGSGVGGRGSGTDKARGGPASAGAAGAGAGKAGAAGMAGMGGMGGAGKGKGGDDEDRQSKFLVGDDPNDLFGTDELTAPPVIGE